MNLGRAPLLVEGLPARKQVDPRAATRDAPRINLGPDDVREPKPRPRRQGGGLGLAGWGSAPPSDSRVDSREKSFSIPLSQSTLAKVDQHNRVSRDSDEEKLDSRFPTPYHRSVHQMPADKAHAELDKIWSRRHDVNPADQPDEDRPANKHRLPLRMPGLHHPDQSVRDRAWKMQAQSEANAAGDSYTQRDRAQRGAKRTSPRVKTRVVQGPSGRYTSTQFPNKPSTPLPKGHQIVHSTISEGLRRGALLAEGLPATSEPRRTPPLSSDDDVKRKLQSATPEVAARLRQSLAFREKLRSTKQWEPPASEAPTEKLKAVDPNAKTRIMRPAGHRTEILRPPGHKTQVALTTVQQKSPTAVLPAAKVPDLDEPKSGAKTQNLRAQRTEWTKLPRTPILQEFVANTFLSKFPAGTRISGAPGVQGVTDTSKVGLVTAQGGVVPDKKKRELKIPDMTKLPAGRDPITKQLEQQPSNAGLANPLLARRTRTEDALAESCSTCDIWAITSSRKGYGIQLPEDDYVGQYRQFRETCPEGTHLGHAAFCSRCDNSFPTQVGGVDWLKRDDWKETPTAVEPEDPYNLRGTSAAE